MAVAAVAHGCADTAPPPGMLYNQHLQDEATDACMHVKNCRQGTLPSTRCTSCPALTSATVGRAATLKLSASSCKQQQIADVQTAVNG
jgi:hypothetical protein